MRSIWPGGTPRVPGKDEPGKGGTDDEEVEPGAEGLETFAGPFREINESKPENGLDDGFKKGWGKG